MDANQEAANNGSKASGSPAPIKTVKPIDPEANQPATASQLADVEKQTTAYEKSTLRWAKTAVIMSGLAAVFVSAQWWEMHSSSGDTHNLATAAGNQATWTERLKESTDAQSGHMKDLAEQMKVQADQTRKIAEQALIQSKAAKTSATAAGSAATTAKDALHVSERAYIVLGKPALDTTQKLLTLQFVNSGRIPSGNAKVVAHEATFNIPTVTYKSQWFEAVEKRWESTKFFSIDPGVPMGLGIPVTELSVDKLNVGLQIIVVSGFITYTDGFDGTPQQRQLFCLQTMFQTTSKQYFLSPCDPVDYLPKMEAVDGYPNNESKQ